MAENTHDLEVSRFIRAPRKRVFAAFLSDKDERMTRFAPTGPDGRIMRCILHDFEPRVGGRMSYSMVAAGTPDTIGHRVDGTFVEIVEAQKIVRTEIPSVPPDGPSPPTTTVTILFEDALLDDGTMGTQVTIRHEGIPDPQWAEGAKHGWASALENLAAAWAEA